MPIYKKANDAAESGTFADFMEAFKTFDREGQGFINAAEMPHVLTSLGIMGLFLYHHRHHHHNHQFICERVINT